MQRLTGENVILEAPVPSSRINAIAKYVHLKIMAWKKPVKTKFTVF